MNIFAKVILTTNDTIKNKLVENQVLVQKENNENYEIYFKTWSDFHTVLIYNKTSDFSASVNFVIENFEVINFYNIGIALSVDSVDLKFGDVVVPNTIIDMQDNALFLENFTDKNYDLNKFWLVLNWLCLTLDKKIESEEELLDIKNDYACDIFDFESYKIWELLKQKNLSDKYNVVKVIWEDEEYLANAVDILEFFM